MLRRARLTVAYDGTSFHGFAENDGVRSVMGELREALEKMLQQPVDLVGAGRTDAGVHGWGQVVSCDLPDEIDLQALVRRLNRMCGPSVVVRDGAWAESQDFSARFSAKERRLPPGTTSGTPPSRTRFSRRRPGTSISRCRCRRCDWLVIR